MASGPKVTKSLLIILLLAVSAVLITVYPVLTSGLAATFYATDPDVHYLSNSLLFIQSNKIVYNNHPGTPAIILISLFLLPLRAYASIVAHTPFIDWSFLNVSITYYFIRIAHSVLLGLSTCMFLAAVYKMTRSIFAATISFLALFVYTAFLYTGSTISAEGSLFFFTSLWLLLFSHYQKSRSRPVSVLMLVIAGIALATKFTAIPLALASILIYMDVSKSNWRRSLVNLVKAAFLIAAVFIFCTLPIRATYTRMFHWLAYLATTTETHGGGTKAIFNLASYSLSVKGLISREPWAAAIVLSSVVGLVSLNLSTAILFGSAVASLLVFAKYPLSYYQIVPYTLLVFIGSLSVRSFPKIFRSSLLVILILPAVANISSSHATIIRSAEKVAVLEEYIQKHPPKRATVWEWGRSKDFALLWSRDWGGGIFSKQLTKYRPDLLGLESNFERVKITDRRSEPVFSTCWDQLYIQQASAKVFMAKYPKQKLSYTALPGTDDMALVESKHCLTKP